MVEDGAAVIGRDVGGAFEGAFDEDIAMGGLEVADPGERAAAVAEGAAVREEAAAAEDGIAASVDGAAFEVHGSIGLERVAVADDVDAVQGDAVAAEEEPFGLAHEVGGEGDILQNQVVAMVEGDGRPPLREGPGPLVGLDRQRVRVEHLVIGIMHAGDVRARADDGDMGLVPHVHDFFVVAGHYLDNDGTPRRVARRARRRPEVRNRVQRPLQRAKVPGARGVHDERVRQRRRFRIDGEGPSPRSRREDSLVDLDPIGMPILQHIVVRIDHRGGAAHEHRMEMECVREPADDGELVLRRRGLGRPRRGAGHGIPVRRHETPAVVVRDLGIVDIRCIRPALRRPRWHGQVETVHARAALDVPDPEPSARAHGRFLREGERQVRVHMDPFRAVRREQCNLLRRCARHGFHSRGNQT